MIKRLYVSQKLLYILTTFVSILTIIILSKNFFWPGGLGFEKKSSLISKSFENDKQGNLIKYVETKQIDDGKTLWDWLSLLGVPLTLAMLGYLFQYQQERRTQGVLKEQEKIASNEIMEDVLQGYFDRISILLIDQNILSIAIKRNADIATFEENELLDSAVDVIRTRTITILRRFKNDIERKTSVIQFLSDADIISKLNLSLNEADLSGADLMGVKLEGANLNFANLSDSNLFGANISRANLQGANLQGANLQGANLQGANLQGANLQGANLQGANLQGANLQGANLKEADFRGTDLKNSIWDTDTTWPDRESLPPIP